LYVCVEHNFSKKSLRLLIGCSAYWGDHSALFPVPGRDLIIRRYILVSHSVLPTATFTFYKYLIEKGPPSLFSAEWFHQRSLTPSALMGGEHSCVASLDLNLKIVLNLCSEMVTSFRTYEMSTHCKATMTFAISFL